ncbi:putative IQ motif and ankyrin repeat domain-containing protein LOC642574 homolog isoform X2 [Rhinatrema bivittatum]|uniref:putative IQ motif and ankyrin repeat domain-containing protein LOC642574 homolog isoform X2 n=1 Tax=Rhinatrema bivittatum TaxID=194408 RepID=UPI00112D5063|nr:putative IQ motif and ankyrin repeat domain-containing protein LOC642574 homolog isoform X2 [Rhinatrema bivittatum]
MLGRAGTGGQRAPGTVPPSLRMCALSFCFSLSLEPSISLAAYFEARSSQVMSGKADARKGAKASPPKKQPGPQTVKKGQPVNGKPPASQKTGGKPTKKTDSEDPSHAGTDIEHKAALTIQCAFRKILAQKRIAKLQKDKQAYEELMDRLQKEAFVMMVKKEQEAAELQRKKEEEERKKKQEEVRRKKRILEAAFDGDVEEVLAVLKEVSDLDTKNGVGYDEAGKVVRLRNQINMVDCTDANGNTPLSEAAGGGNPEVIKLLIERGAQPNSKGAFGRTPLYRAAFGAHLAALEMLLQYGADPRIHADDGTTPEQVSSLDSLSDVLRSWDTSLTDSMLQKMEAEKQRRALEEQRMKDADTDRMRNEVLKLTTEHERCQKELQQAYCELNRRITEHDKCMVKHRDKTELTLQSIHDAEATVESVRITAMKAEERLSLARLRLREQTSSGTDSGLPGLKCFVQELDEVLLKDVGNKVRLDGRWPLIIDPSGQAAIFLRYRDTNYLNTLNPADMQPETIRMALLGALRRLMDQCLSSGDQRPWTAWDWQTAPQLERLASVVTTTHWGTSRSTPRLRCSGINHQPRLDLADSVSGNGI